MVEYLSKKYNIIYCQFSVKVFKTNFQQLLENCLQYIIHKINFCFVVKLQTSKQMLP